MAIEIFHDTVSANAHREFELWRGTHLADGVFLNRRSKSEVMLHRADCPHLEFGRTVSLTAKQKICSMNPAELRSWAFRSKVRVKSCDICDI